jgi:hypothetical protein
MKEEEASYEVEGITFKIFHIVESEIQQLNESRDKGRPLIGTFSYDIHKPHNPTGEYHLILYDKGKEILAMNKVSGTAHDGYHGIRIPNKAYGVLKNRFGDWNWPDNQIIESREYTYIIDKKDPHYIRPVRVNEYKDDDMHTIGQFFGFFHRFADDPFMTGGGRGWIEKTVALVENEDGYVLKVPMAHFRFLDSGL